MVVKKYWILYIRFTPFLSTPVDKTLSPYTIKEACRKTGIFLLNIETNQLAPREPTNRFSSAKKEKRGNDQTINKEGRGGRTEKKK